MCSCRMAESCWSALDLLIVSCGLLMVREIFIQFCGGFKFAFSCHFLPWVRKTDLVKKYGPWAVVTGASSGIGLGFARGLASQGFNVLLVSRRQAALDIIASQIGREYRVETKVVACDAASRDYQPILDSISALDLAVLVNNVGTLACSSSGRPLALHQTDTKQMYDVMTVNCGAALVLTRHALQRMRTRGTGLVVNVTSVSAYAPLPYLAQYSATKVFLDVMSKCLREEAKESGVTVKCLRPLVVKTDMTSCNAWAYDSPLAHTPQDYLQHVLPSLDNGLSTSGHWLADLYMWPFKNFGQWYRTALTTTLLPYFVKHGREVTSRHRTAETSSTL